MKVQARLLLLLATVFAALVASRVGVVAAGTYSTSTMPAHAVLRGGSVEDDVGFGAELGEEAAYPQRRVLAYNPGSVSYGGLEANKAACYGSCPGRGQAYSGGGCQPIYGCRGR